MNLRDFRWMLLGILLGVGLFVLFGTGLGFHRDIASPLEAAAPAPSQGGHVYFSGQVHNIGAILLKPDDRITVSQAIILNGGLSDFADPRHVRVLRQGAGANASPLLVDFAKIANGETTPDPVVQPGDTIVVPQRLVNF